MFRIGEFSKIAQVPGSLLRYYDQIGLLKPAHIDQWTGYRYYSAKQLPRLHRILALKELGLTLEQITRLVEEEVSAAEIRGMLTLKKAQVEQTVQEEMTRLRSLEARLQHIDDATRPAYDIVIKNAPALNYLSVREVLPGAATALNIMKELFIWRMRHWTNSCNRRRGRLRLNLGLTAQGLLQPPCPVGAPAQQRRYPSRSRKSR